MTSTEKRIASFIKDHWEEKEDCLGVEYYRIYADSTFDGALQDCYFSDCKLTDVLCLEYVTRESGRSFVQVFASTPEDEGQDWFTLSDLSRRDRANVVRLFDGMIAARGFTVKSRIPGKN